MNYILKIRIKHCTKEVLRIAKIVLIALILLIGLILIKYKPLYKVEINNKEIGYVKNKIQFNNLIKENIEKTDNTKIAFITLSDEPEYEFKLVTNRQQTNEEEIITSLKENSIVTYTAYGITLNEDIKAYVENEQEAQDTVNLLKEQYSKDENYINIGIRQIYTQEDIQTVNLENAVKTLTPIAEKEIDIKVKEKEKENAIAVVNSVVIAAKPVSGSITSRFSENSRIRSSAHTGLDIATKTGTPIKVCSSGKVIFAEIKELMEI